MNTKATKSALILMLVLSMIACQKNDDNPATDPGFDIKAHNDSLRQKLDSITISLRNDIIDNLNGKWVIDSMEIEFRNTHANSEAGINSDTIFTDFGEIDFGDWTLLLTSGDSTSFENKASLIFEGHEYPLSFDYLIYLPGEPGAVYSFLTENAEGLDEWTTDDGWFIRHVGLLDNVQLQKINNDEFYLIGLNKGMKKMKITRE